MENETEVVDTQNNQQDDAQTVESETLSPEEIADLKHKADVSSQNFERAKKAEAEKKALEAELAKHKDKPQDSLKDDDVLYIAKSDIHSEDLADLRTHMKNYGVSAKEAHEFLKPILAVRQEERKTSNATLTKGGAKGSGKVTGEDLLRRKNEKGEFPDEEDIDKMIEADFEARKKASKRN